MKKLFRNKKGSDQLGFESTNKVFFYITLLIFVGILIPAFIFLIINNYQSEISVEEEILADFRISRVTNICFAYIDPITNQIKQNYIDLSKVDDRQLNSCFVDENKGYFKIEIKPVFEGDFENKMAKLKELTYSDTSFKRYVLAVKENGEVKPAWLYYTP